MSNSTCSGVGRSTAGSVAHWRRWLVEQPLGWDESGIPGRVAYPDDDLWPFQEAEAILLLDRDAYDQLLRYLGAPYARLDLEEAIK